MSTDIVDDIGTLYDGETYAKGDLASLEDMMRVLEGADMVVHMGAYADEGPFEKLLGPNFVGAYNIWERCTGTNAALRACICAFCLAPK